MTDPDNLLILTVGAFVLGWIVAKVSAHIGNRFAARARDPREAQIRSLSAELRISKSETEKLNDTLAGNEAELKETKRKLDQSGVYIGKLQELVASLKKDLKGSVRKTHELRTELSRRATESIKSEVKLREVETELSVAQASTDLMAAGMLDYSDKPEADDDEQRPRLEPSIG